MQAAHIRNKLPLHWNKIIAMAFFGMAMAAAAHAQRYTYAPQNNPNYDDRKVSYGFVIGFHTSAYQVKYSDQFVTQNFDTVHSVMTPGTLGLSLGFLVNFHLYEFLDVRLLPKAGFYNHKLEYYYTNGKKDQQLIETTLLELPVLAKYRSMRRGNVRMYVLGGMTYGFELSGKNNSQSSNTNIDIMKHNLSIDTGIGFDLYFPLFKLSPELRFSKGISNMLGPEPSVYRDPLKRLNTNTVSLYFIFQ